MVEHIVVESRAEYEKRVKRNNRRAIKILFLWVLPIALISSGLVGMSAPMERSATNLVTGQTTLILTKTNLDGLTIIFIGIIWIIVSFYLKIKRKL